VLFKIRLEAGAGCICEWRDQASPYHTGPCIRFQNNSVFFNNRKLLDIPDDGWIDVKMQSPLGQAKSKWSLSIVLPDGKKQEFKDLDSAPEWKSARWLGFISVSATNTSFYLDDLLIQNK
jgi:hypothetical protein